MIVLLALYNGAQNLREQLDSYISQTYRDWGLIVSDDGSSDEGPEIARRFSAEVSQPVELRPGPRRGFAQNFLSLLHAAGQDARYVALSDQDDVWMADKLERAVRALRDVPEGVPAMYCSRTWVWNSRTGETWLSHMHPREPNFRNALVQNIAGGNTIVLNRAALDIAQAAADEASDIVCHDWWLYQMVTGTGGMVVYDPEPTLYYRQHNGNQIGANTTTLARLTRIALILTGRFRGWNTRNVTALRRSAHRFTPENRRILNRFAAARRQGLTRRLAMLHRSGVHRQTTGGNAGLWLAAFLNKF
nr:glycosyltransferase family 2 protein [Rhodovulum robiginosum]